MAVEWKRGDNAFVVGTSQMLVSSLHHPPNSETKCADAAEQLDKHRGSQGLPVCGWGDFEQQGTETPTRHNLIHKEFVFLHNKGEKC